MNSPEIAATPRWRHVALAACMFLVTSTFGFVQPFVPLYLEASGLRRGQIGLVTGVGSGLALLIQPLLGRLSDRLDARRPIMVAAALVAGCAYQGYRAAHHPLVFVLLSALGVNGVMYLNAVGGVLVGRMVSGRSQGGAAYARYRVWGSVGYIVVSLLTGLLLRPALHPSGALSRAALDPVFTYGPLLFFAIALVACLVPDQRNAPPAPGLPSHAPLERPALPPNLRRFLLSFFLYTFGLYGASAYLSLYMKSLGATPLWITGTFATGVVCEVLIMTRSGRWSDLYGRRPVLAVTYLLMPLRLLLYIGVSRPFGVLLVQSLHGINFGIMGTIAVVFINDTATNQERGMAQARLSAVGGLATALGPGVCGGLADALGLRWMFGAMAVVGVAGAFVFMTCVEESHPAPVSLAERGPSLLRPLWRWLSHPPRQPAKRRS